MKRLQHRKTGAVYGYNAILAAHPNMVTIEEIEGTVEAPKEKAKKAKKEELAAPEPEKVEE